MAPYCCGFPALAYGDVIVNDQPAARPVLGRLLGATRNATRSPADTATVPALLQVVAALPLILQLTAPTAEPLTNRV